MSKMRISYGELCTTIWVVMFVFQEALSRVVPAFSYVDELPLFLFAMYIAVRVFRSGKLSIKREEYWYAMALMTYVIVGLLGNIIYRYQPMNVVIVDLLTNLKFFGAILFFTMWFNDGKTRDKHLLKAARAISIFLLVVFLIDRVADIFPAEYRYGIKSAVLFYPHPTYLAGICAFLIGLMTIYDADKNKPYILINLILLSFTLRSKAIVSAIVYVILYIIIKKLHGKLKIWQIAVVGIVGIGCAWSQIYFYFIRLGGRSARSIMLITALMIMKDYFPIGTGFATFASHSAAESYSPVYSKYGFELVYELRNSTEGTFFDDQFWPIIFGQTGVIGTICYLYIMFFLFKKIQRLYRVNVDSYMGGLFVFIYLLISSIAEPAFNNSIAIPLAMVIAMATTKWKLPDLKSGSA